jgi:phospholipid/cholesterol/gamma-HCH transport system ATP-binding protein
MIETRELTKSFGTKKVLQGVSLNVNEGETLVILGRSGSGKSVILKHLIGLLLPDSGVVLVDGEPITGLPERKMGEVRAKIGMLFQSAALFDSMSVEQNLAFPLLEQGIRDMKAIDERVAQALDMVDLSGEQRKMPADLSGGMRKRVGLARTIVGRPRCVLYDEPTTGLDPITTDSINFLIRRLQRKLGVTSIVVTHDMKTAFHCADRIAFLHEGRLHFVGTVAELKANPDTIVQDFIEGRSGDTE